VRQRIGDCVVYDDEVYIQLLGEAIHFARLANLTLINLHYREGGKYRYSQRHGLDIAESLLRRTSDHPIVVYSFLEMPDFDDARYQRIRDHPSIRFIHVNLGSRLGRNSEFAKINDLIGR
jgi:hypothetical protein